MEYPTRIRLLIVFFVIVAGLLADSCGLTSASQKYRSGDHIYEYRQRAGRYKKAWVFVEGDSVQVLSYKNPEQIIYPTPGEEMYFLKRAFDFDAMTVGFKFRPDTPSLPRQLNTDFNGNAYFGYRFDRTKRREEPTPFGRKVIYGHRAFSLGVFGGIGSTVMSPWTTRNLMTDEYYGFVLTRGFGFLIALNDLNVGFGVGWDYLTDRDKDMWIYQNKPWYGLTIGLNLTSHPTLDGARK